MNKIENRPLGTNEKVYWVLDQKTTTHFAVVAEIDGNATDHQWRQALDTVQQRHPNLSVKISGNEYSTVYFEHVENCKIPLRIAYTKRDEDWTSLLEEELKMPIDITKAPLARAVVIQQSGKSVFIFLSNHSIGDGMSSALFIRDILTVLSGEKLDNLTPVPALDELAALSAKQLPNKRTSDFEQAKNSLLPRPEVNVQRLKLSGALTEKLIKYSKSEKTTVHGALSAALVLALKHVDSALEQKDVRILHPLSARKPLNIGDDFGLLVSMVTLPYKPEPEHTFWDFARKVRKEIAATQTPEWIRTDISATRELFYNEMDVKTIEQALYQGTRHEIMLTNLGQLPFKSDFGGLELKSLWGPMVLTLHDAARTVGVATYNGEMTLTVTGILTSNGLLEATEKIIDQICSTPENIEVGEFLKQPVTDLSNINEKFFCA